VHEQVEDLLEGADLAQPVVVEEGVWVATVDEHGGRLDGGVQEERWEVEEEQRVKRECGEGARVQQHQPALRERGGERKLWRKVLCV
jgi:hypothetical protein